MADALIILSKLAKKTSWEDFAKVFQGVGVVEAVVSSSPTSSLLLLDRAYSIIEINIKNGMAKITIKEIFETPATPPLIACFLLNYTVTQLNLPHLGKRLVSENFRIGVVELAKKDAETTLGEKYFIQVGSKHLIFRGVPQF